MLNFVNLNITLFSIKFAVLKIKLHFCCRVFLLINPVNSNMNTYFILLCLIIGVRNHSENEQISVKTRRSLDSININVPPTIGQISLAIIFDCTGSMADNLKEMKAGAERLIDAITERRDNPIYNYIFVCFRDPGNCFNIFFISI